MNYKTSINWASVYSAALIPLFSLATILIVLSMSVVEIERDSIINATIIYITVIVWILWVFHTVRNVYLLYTATDTSMSEIKTDLAEIRTLLNDEKNRRVDK